MARAGLNWKVRELAEKADVQPNTITNFEKARGVNSNTVKVIKQALLESECVFFDGDNTVSITKPE